MQRMTCYVSRWCRILVFGIPLATMAAAAAAERGPTSTRSTDVAVEKITITVSNADRSAAFFSEVMDFEKIRDAEASGSDIERRYGVFGARVRSVELRLGDETIELLEFMTPRGRVMPRESRSNDRWFQHLSVITSDMDKAYARLRQHHVEYASPEPQTLPASNPNAGGIRAFYFRDPDGHFLEILQFPSDKGPVKWKSTDDRLFLGIDHTAIVVAQTESSRRFYEDLGFKVVGTSDNYGIEQERLNNVLGAHLRITTLRGTSGPGIELLEYLTPRDGRPPPADSRANDLWHWHVSVRRLVPNVPRMANVENGDHDRSVNARGAGHVTAVGDSFVRDVDGHALLVDDRH